MFNYLTKDLSKQQIEDFLTWFDGEVGTDYERQDGGKIMFLELTDQELRRVKNYEKKLDFSHHGHHEIKLGNYLGFKIN